MLPNEISVYFVASFVASFVDPCLSLSSLADKAPDKRRAGNFGHSFPT
jgi:hypothetical protein